MKASFRLGLILFIALMVRLVSLNQSLWLDEAFQVWSVTHYSLKGLLTDYLTGDFNPPLSYLISWLVTGTIGRGEISLRLPSVLFGVLNLWLVYLLAQQLFPKVKVSLFKLRVSLAELAALLLALAPLHIYYSQEVRPYILAALLASWSMYELWRILNQKHKNIWRYVLVTTSMVYSHYMTWLLMPVQVVAILIHHDKEKKGNLFKKMLISWLIIGLLFLPWLPIFLKQLKTGSGVAKALPVWSDLSAVSFKNLSLIPVKFVIGRISIENNWLYGLVMIPILLIIGWLLLITFKEAIRPLSARLATGGREASGAVSYLWLWLVGPILLGLVLSFKWPMLQYFRFLFVLPAFYLLLALGLARVKSSWQPPLVLGLLLINLIATGIYLFNPAFHREDWRGAATFIRIKDMEAAVVILKPVSAPFYYYDHQQAKMIDYSQVSQIRFEKRLWLVKYAQPIFEPNNKTEEIIKQYGFQELLEKHFRGGVTIKYFINSNGVMADRK